MRGANDLLRHYKRLGLVPGATQQEIRVAFSKHARNCHPDLVGKGSEREFRELMRSYRVLKGRYLEVLCRPARCFRVLTPAT